MANQLPLPALLDIAYLMTNQLPLPALIDIAYLMANQLPLPALLDIAYLMANQLTLPALLDIGYLMANQLPLPALQDIAIVTLCVCNIATSKNNSLEIRLKRQCALSVRKSWATNAQDTLDKYDMGTIDDIVACNNPRQTKKLAKQATRKEWNRRLKECAGKSSLGRLPLPPTNHHISSGVTRTISRTPANTQSRPG